jgi:hypothetical protein
MACRSNLELPERGWKCQSTAGCASNCRGGWPLLWREAVIQVSCPFIRLSLNRFNVFGVTKRLQRPVAMVSFDDWDIARAFIKCRL